MNSNTNKPTEYRIKTDKLKGIVAFFSSNVAVEDRSLDFMKKLIDTAEKDRDWNPQ